MNLRNRLLVAGTIAGLLAGGFVPQARSARPELLDSRSAFKVSAHFSGKDVKVRFKIAEGYYVYRAKLAFGSDSPGVRLQPAILPAGQIKDDEFFGRVEIYRDEFAVRVPVKQAGGTKEITFKIRSQGCADAGVCYPPREDVLTLVSGGAEASSEVPAKRGGSSLLDALGGEAASESPRNAGPLR